MVTLMTLTTPASAPDKDIDILTRALTKALGEKTNYNTPRLAGMEIDTKNGKTLVVLLCANYKPTPAGLRHGIFSDVMKTMRVSKSWEWPNRVNGVKIIAQIPTDHTNPKGGFRVVFKGYAASETIQETDWKAIPPARVPHILTAVEMHRILN